MAFVGIFQCKEHANADQEMETALKGLVFDDGFTLSGRDFGGVMKFK